MVLGIFLLAFFIGYIIRAGLRFLVHHFTKGGRSAKAAGAAPAGVGIAETFADDDPGDDQISAWTPLDEVQLTRLLRDSAPK
jgi:hypothetical protein